MSVRGRILLKRYFGLKQKEIELELKAHKLKQEILDAEKEITKFNRYGRIKLKT